eukprot:TRINITY_DN24135_c0_g1_i2.p1 TRINITY_DN24135_c0_g1~~TRINITY_DN24135_c0_g1_i2.p1  ORF type:complete len:107 (+),score=4.63 TRINITY_DN24135_c0_g1_i2:77-397(+)
MRSAGRNTEQRAGVVCADADGLASLRALRCRSLEAALALRQNNVLNAVTERKVGFAAIHKISRKNRCKRPLWFCKNLQKLPQRRTQPPAKAPKTARAPENQTKPKS